MEKPLLSYESVEVCYDGHAVLQDVSFSLFPGEILGIAGESGSGKSTLLKAAMGLLGKGGQVSRGAIFFQGQNLCQASEKEMRAIRGRGLGMIFQEPGASFCPVRTLGSQITESLGARGRVARNQAKAQALSLFEALHLKDGERLWNSYPFQLSGGMNQRVAIALAMLQKPPVLLCDEPTSALDSLSQKQVMEQLLKLRQLFGTAMVLVTHHMGLLSAMADRILVLKEGQAMEYGKASQVLHSPQSAYTKALLEAAPRLKRG